jgi:hypothetical protein
MVMMIDYDKDEMMILMAEKMIMVVVMKILMIHDKQKQL